jgi:hypothetical protein
MLVRLLGSEKVMLVNFGAPWNAPIPILVTLFGMLMLVKPDSWNAAWPMLVTLLGMVMLVRLVVP